MLSIGAFVGTYLVHGVILFLLAWAGSLVIRSQRVREQLWRVALFGPLLTASAQVGGGLAPLAGTWDVGPGAARAEAPVATPAPDGPGAIPARLAPAALAPAPLPEARRGTWEVVGLLATVLGLIAITWRAAMEAVRMRALGKRTPLDDPELERDLAELSAAAGLLRPVRLETAERGISPYATGILRPRIVIPGGALRRFARAERRAMLAHELGHIARLDCAWTAAARSVATLFFFQPLNWVLLRRLDEAAEFACDRFAVQLTRDEVAMARCLTSVAEMIVGRGPTPACPMAHRRSKLSERVERILEVPAGGQAPRRRGGALAGAILVAATAVAAPGLAMSEPAGPRPVAFAAGSALPAGDLIISLYAEIERSAAMVEAEARALAELHGGQDPEIEERLASFRRRASNLRGLARAVIERRLSDLALAPPYAAR